MSPLACLMLAVVLQGASTVLLKQRVAALAGGVELGALVRRPRRFFAPLVRDPFWLLGWVLLLVGALAGLQALSEVDLVLMQALGKLQLLVVVAAGVLLLGERLEPAEWLAVAVMALAALGLAPGTGQPTGVVVPTRTSLSFLAVSLGLLGSAWLLLRTRREFAHAAAAGAFLGAGDLLVKAATGQVREATGTFHALGSLGDLLRTPELAAALPCYVGGLVLVQAAFSIGRVSVVGPVSAVIGSLLPVLFGVYALEEVVQPARAAGLVAILSAAALLARRGSPRGSAYDLAGRPG
jgi:chloramphenicol-sensitive protein RarD